MRSKKVSNLPRSFYTPNGLVVLIFPVNLGLDSSRNTRWKNTPRGFIVKPNLFRAYCIIAKGIDCLGKWNAVQCDGICCGSTRNFRSRQVICDPKRHVVAGFWIERLTVEPEDCGASLPVSAVAYCCESEKQEWKHLYIKDDVRVNHR